MYSVHVVGACTNLVFYINTGDFVLPQVHITSYLEAHLTATWMRA